MPPRMIHKVIHKMSPSDHTIGLTSLFKRFVVLFIALILSGCGASPAPDIVGGEQFAVDDFSRQGDWERYNHETLIIAVSDGKLRAVSYLPDRYAWSLRTGDSYSDHRITADVYLLNANPNALYGLVCRASGSGDSTGYYFLLTGDGRAVIRQGINRTSEFADLTRFVRVTDLQPATEGNRLQAVCAGDYLGLYVNDQLIVSTTNSDIDAGYAGVVVGQSGAIGVDVAVDDVVIEAVTFSE